MYLKMLLQSRQWGYTSKIVCSQIASLAKDSELCTSLACSMGKNSYILNYTFTIFYFSFLFINEARSWGWEWKNWVGVNFKKSNLLCVPTFTPSALLDTRFYSGPPQMVVQVAPCKRAPVKVAKAGLLLDKKLSISWGIVNHSSL